MEQKIIFADDKYKNIEDYFRRQSYHRVLLVHGSSMYKLEIGKFLLSMSKFFCNDWSIVEFMEFESNPAIEAAIQGARLCKEKNCDIIIACGGGSAMDVAKCIRLFVANEVCSMEDYDNLVTLKPGEVPLVVIPTTAGTGSEATHFAVVYRQDEKLSIAEPHNVPQTVIYDVRTLKCLPMEVKKANFFDALCHGIESYWSKNATMESRVYSREAIRLLLALRNDYIMENESGVGHNMAMFMAAYYAGRAINIAKTTAAHAMCYTLTSHFGLYHGQAAVRTLLVLWQYLLEIVAINDTEQNTKMMAVMFEIANLLGVDSVETVGRRLTDWLEEAGYLQPLAKGEIRNLAAELSKAVNAERLKNFPLQLSQSDITIIYEQILKGRC